MTIDAGLSTYPMGDEPQHNLQRMFADMKRVDLARRFLDDVLRKGTDVFLIAVDLDRSAVVRRRGVREERAAAFGAPGEGDVPGFRVTRRGMDRPHP
jgi:hypothetical protein